MHVTLNSLEIIVNPQKDSKRREFLPQAEGRNNAGDHFIKIERNLNAEARTNRD